MPGTILKSRNAWGHKREKKMEVKSEQLHVLPRPIHFHVKDTVLGNKKKNYDKLKRIY